MIHPDNCTVCGHDKFLVDRITLIRKDWDIDASTSISMGDVYSLLKYIDGLEKRQIPCGWICHP